MSKKRLAMALDPEEDKLLLPSSSSEDEQELNSEASDEEEPEIQDPFLNEDSDSDEAPDAVSFKSALEDSKNFKRQTTEVIKTHLEERRRKRKELHDEFLLRKEEKRQKIDEKKLPDDILENLEDDPIAESKESPDGNDESGFEGEDEEEETVKSCDPEEVVAVHGPTTFKCKVLPVESKKPKFVSENILHFKDQLLYGGRIRREKSSREALLKREKQLMSHHLRTAQ